MTNHQITATAEPPPDEFGRLTAAVAEIASVTFWAVSVGGEVGQPMGRARAVRTLARARRTRPDAMLAEQTERFDLSDTESRASYEALLERLSNQGDAA